MESNVSRPAAPAPQPQCEWLRERIDALAAEAELETDPARARQWRRERRALLRRAEQLGCLCERAGTVPQPL